MPTRASVCVLSLDEMAGHSRPRLLASRPTLGIGLPPEVAGACQLGNLSEAGASLLDSAAEVTLPPYGSRFVVARTDLPSLAAAAWLDLRIQRRHDVSRGRHDQLVRALHRAHDPCQRLRWDDLSGFDNDDPTLVRASICHLTHQRRLPVHYRLDVCQRTFGSPHGRT